MGRMGLCCWNGSEGFSVFSWWVKLFLNTQGAYILFSRNNANGVNDQTLKQGTISGFPTGTGQIHTIGVVANGDQISLYVDNLTTPVIPPIVNSTYSSGQIGVLAADNTNATAVTFNAAEVWQLP